MKEGREKRVDVGISLVFVYIFRTIVLQSLLFCLY